MLNRSDSENIASNYFKTKRANQLLSGESMKSLGKSFAHAHTRCSFAYKSFYMSMAVYHDEKLEKKNLKST